MVLSKKFYEYFKEVEDKEFISLCSEKENNRYISKGKWTGWFIGGKRNYDLFRFITCFFEVYFKNHNISIDYMLVDDAVHYYYTKNKLYQKIIDEQAREWDPYLFTRNYKSTDLDEIFEMFNGKIKYSVQKFSYKINTEKDISNNSLYCILCKKSKTGLNEKKNEK